MSKSITANGYSILKTDLTEYQQKLLRKDLSFTPLDLSGYGQFCDNSINLYRESQDRVYMPRFYGLKKFGEPDKDYLRDAPRNKLKLSKIKQPKIPEDQKTEFDKRREMVQKQAIKACKKRLKGPGGGILVLPCGYGKTRTALKIWLKLKVPVIILAHKEYLLEQFEEEIRKMVHDPKIGYISGKKVDYEQKDVLLAMIQSFISKDLDWKAIKSHYQMMIADECHHLAAPVFNNCLGKISTRYLLGLSATPNRTDKLEDIFKAYLGDVIYEFKAPQNNSVIVDQYIIDNHGQKEYTMLYNKSEKPNKSAMITNICKYDRRNDFIVDKIKEMHDQGRSILVLSGRCGKKKTTRREKYIQQNKVKKGKIKTSDSSESEDENPEETVKHLDILADKLREKYGIESLIYTGGDKLDKLKKMDTLNVLFSTYNMVNEGFNLPKLNSLIYTTPISDTTQSRGRIMRIQHANHTPLIVDLCDNFGGFDNQGRRRVGDYKKAGYQITKIHLNQDFSEGKKSKVELPKDKKVDDEDDFAFTSETGCLL